MQAMADLSAIFAEDPNAIIQGTNSAPPASLGFEEPPQLPGALFDFLESLVRVSGVMPTTEPTCKCTARARVRLAQGICAPALPRVVALIVPSVTVQRSGVTSNCARADGLAAADFAVTTADAQSPVVARSAPALRVRQTAIDSLLTSVVEYTHRQIVVAHLLDYSQVRCISDLLQHIDVYPTIAHQAHDLVQRPT